MRKYFSILLVCLVISILLLSALYISSPLNKEIYRGDFERRFLNEKPIEKISALNLGLNSFYIAGTSDNEVFLGNWTAPFHVLIVNTISLDTQHVNIRVKDYKQAKHLKKFRLKVDSPYFYLFNGAMPGIYKGAIKSWEASRFMNDSAHFEDAIPITSSSFALRSYSISNKSYELAKEKIDTPHFKFKYEPLEKQIDGVFCVDGDLHYSKQLRKLIYIYTYRNQFIVMDTNLNLLSRHHTIDPFFKAHIEVASIESKSKTEILLSSPPSTINAMSCVTEKTLEVLSNVLAKNEGIENFKSANVVDVYNLQDGAYMYSYYIPSQASEKASDFVITKKNLVSINGRNLVTYSIKKPKN